MSHQLATDMQSANSSIAIFTTWVFPRPNHQDFFLENMHLNLSSFLLIPSVLGLVSNLTTTNGSFIDDVELSPANWLPSCANAQFPLTWSAPISAYACAGAINLLRHGVAALGHRDRTFFSHQFVPNPPPGAWGLPSGFSNGELPL